MAPPDLRCDLHLGTIWQLPSWSVAPRGADGSSNDDAFYEAVASAGYGGVQGGDPGRCHAAGLVPTTFGVHRELGTLRAQVELWRDLGFALATLHVGTGIEDDDTALRYFDEVLTVADEVGLPLYVETHRATLTQDIWRTVQLVEQLPELRFNGDFSHWYTGLEMTYGDFEAKLDFAEPVFERVRYLHGRIGDPGCIQIDVLADEEPPSVDHFRQFWTRAAAGFQRRAGDGEVLAFAPELLPPSINYAQTAPVGTDGAREEESDRWLQALRLCEIARACYDVAAAG